MADNAGITLPIATAHVYFCYRPRPRSAKTRSNVWCSAPTTVIEFNNECRTVTKRGGKFAVGMAMARGRVQEGEPGYEASAPSCLEPKMQSHAVISLASSMRLIVKEMLYTLLERIEGSLAIKNHGLEYIYIYKEKRAASCHGMEPVGLGLRLLTSLICGKSPEFCLQYKLNGVAVACISLGCGAPR